MATKKQQADLTRTRYPILFLAEAYEYVVPFEPYQDVKKGKEVASATK